MSETTSKMHRGQAGKLFGGVCGALAAQFGRDVVLLRVAFVVAAVLSFGTAVGVYLLFWILTPAAPGLVPPAHRWMDAANRWASGAPSGQPVPDAEEPRS